MTDPLSDSTSSTPADPQGAAGATPKFTKAAQPELPLEQRKQKAGWNKNRFGIWIIVGGFGLFLIGQGIVGILTKAR